MKSQSYVHDVESVSGGTGFVIISMPDPVVASAGTGLEIESRLRPTLQEDELLLDISVRDLRTTFDETIQVLTAIDGRGPHVTDEGVPLPTGPTALKLRWLPFTLDLPRQRSTGFQTRELLPRDREVLLSLTSTGPGRGRLWYARWSPLAATQAPARASGESEVGR